MDLWKNIAISKSDNQQVSLFVVISTCLDPSKASVKLPWYMDLAFDNEIHFNC